jgi:hypothetical protein
MSACPKIDFEYEYVPAAGTDETGAAPARAARPSISAGLAWWHRAIHVVALLGFLGFCAFIGLLWFALAIEAG